MATPASGVIPGLGGTANLPERRALEFQYTPVDTSALAEGISEAIDISEAKKKAKKKATEISPVDSKGMHHAHVQVLRKGGEDLEVWANEHAKELREGDPNTLAEFDRKQQGLMDFAQMSTSAKGNYYALAKNISTKGEDEFLGIESYHNLNNPEYYMGLYEQYGGDLFKVMAAGDLQYQNVMQKPEAIIYGDRVKNVLLPKADSIADGSSIQNWGVDKETGEKYTYYEKKFTIGEAEKLIERDINDNPVIFAQATAAFNKLPENIKEKYNYTGGMIDYYKNTWAPELVQNVSKTTPKGPFEKSPFEINIGDGFAENEMYKFFGRTSEGATKEEVGYKGIEVPESIVVDVQYKKGKTAMSDITFSDESGQEVITGQITSFRKDKGGEWMVNVKTPEEGARVAGRETKKDNWIPYSQIKGDVMAKYGDVDSVFEYYEDSQGAGGELDFGFKMNNKQ